MYKLGTAAGLLATTSKYCNADAVPLQKQHNDKCTLKKLMEYSLDTFSKKDNDSGECSDAAAEGDEAAQNQMQNNATKGGCWGRRGVTTAKQACSKTPGKDTNQKTKSSCCGGGCNKAAQQVKNNEMSNEKLAKKTCSGTVQTVKDTLKDLKEGLDTVAEYAENVAAGIKSDMCASMPFPECTHCPHRPNIGSSDTGLTVPEFMDMVDRSIDALTAGAVGTAMDIMGCPGIAAALARGDYGALGAAMVDTGIRALVSTTIASGSVPMLNTILDAVPEDTRNTILDPRNIAAIMQTATSGSSSCQSPKNKASKQIKTAAAKVKMGAIKTTQTKTTPSVGSKQKELEDATPTQLVAFIVHADNEDDIVAAILAAGPEAEDIVAKAVAAKEAQGDSPLAAYVDGIYTGSVGVATAGGNVEWFDELINLLITANLDADTLFVVPALATTNADAQFAPPDEYTGVIPKAQLEYEGRLYDLSDAEKEAIATLKAVSTVTAKAINNAVASSKDKGKAVAVVIKNCPTTIDSNAKAIDVDALTLKSNGPIFRITRLPGCTLQLDDLKAAVAIKALETGDETPVDVKFELIKTDVDLLIYK